MKTLKVMLSVFVCMLAFTVSTVSISAPIIDHEINSERSIDPNKKKIDPAKLPLAVKEAIEDGEYANWQISKAYKITFDEKPDKVEYEVHFKNKKMEKETEQYTKEGEIVEN